MITNRPESLPLPASPWSNVYGTTRTLLAVATLSTLLADGYDRLFRPLGQELAQPGAPWPIKISLFTLLRGEWLWLGWIVAISILVVVAIGWRPRVTGILHWWVAHSFATSCLVVEGGDQAAALITLLLVPITITDRRVWHWQQAPRLEPRLRDTVASLVAGSAVVVIRLQVAVIYFVASTSKLSVPEWSNGTALYYWMLYPVFGVPEYLEPLIVPILAHPVLVTLLTWGSLALEATLFAGLFMKESYRRVLLPLGIVFHVGIALLQGLFSFSLIMIGALFLYLRAIDEPFRWNNAATRLETWTKLLAIGRRRLTPKLATR